MIYGDFLNEGFFDKFKKKKEDIKNNKNTNSNIQEDKDKKDREICMNVIKWLPSYITKLMTPNYKNKIKLEINKALKNDSLNLDDSIEFAKLGKIPKINIEFEEGVIHILECPEEIARVCHFILNDINNAIKSKFGYEFDIFDDDISIYPYYWL